MIRSTLAICLLTTIAIPALALAEPGDMMHMTVGIKMQMANAPVNIPAQSFSKDICVSKQHDARDVVAQSQRNKNCSVSNYKMTASGGGFHYVCTGNMQLEGDGSFAMTAGGGAHVTISTAGNVHGQPVSANFTIDTTPTGAACEYTPPAAAP
jgi:hypothetical protein